MPKKLIVSCVLIGAVLGVIFVFWPVANVASKGVIVENGVCETTGLSVFGGKSWGKPFINRVVFTGPCSEGPNVLSKTKVTMDFFAGLVAVFLAGIFLDEAFRRISNQKHRAKS